MTKPKPELAAAKLLRASIIALLRDKGAHTLPGVAAAIGCTEAAARGVCMRLVKAGLARSVRSQGSAGRVVITHYHLVEQVPGAAMRTAAKPSQAMVKDWTAQPVRDPFHLPQTFFSRTA